MSYKGYYKTIKEAAEDNKYISYIPSKDGKIYEIRNTSIGVISTPATKVNIEEMDEVKPFFKYRLPKAPYEMLLKIIAFFKYFNNIENGKEAMVQLYWDKTEKEYHIEVPKQKVNKVEVTTEEEPLNENKYTLVADIHSHNNMKAKFSAQDDYDEKATRIYIVLGRLDKTFPEISIRVSNGGKFLYLRLEDIFEFPDIFPVGWLKKVEIMKDEKEKLEKLEREGLIDIRKSIFSIL